LAGHTFSFDLQVDCNTGLWFVELAAVEEVSAKFTRAQSGNPEV
jgi:hypothetical protein